MLTKTKFKTQAEKKEFLDNEINHLQEMSQDNAKTKKELELSIDKLEIKANDSKKSLEKYEKELILLENDIKSLQKALLDKKMEKLQMASEFRGNLEKINEFSFEIDENQRNLHNLKENLDRKFKENFFSTICRIKEILIERKIPGFYGLLIDMLQFDPKLRLGIESIAKNKLYSLIVEDYDTAKEIIQINKEIKGVILNIYPLSWTKELKNKPRNFPKSQDVIILRDRITISKEFAEKNEELAILIEHIFGKGLMVKNYDLALKFSKEFQLTCVTVKGEIVYADGYLTKLGFCDANADKINLYLAFRAKEKENEEKKIMLIEEKKNTDEFHSNEIKILREIQDFSIKESHLKKNIDEIKGKIDDLKILIRNNEENMENSQKIIDKIENENEKIEQKITYFTKEKNVKVSDSNANNGEYQEKNEELLKLQTLLNEIKEQIITTEQKIKENQQIKEEIQKEMQEKPKTNAENNEKNAEKKTIGEIVIELENSLKKIEKKEEEFEKKREDTERKEKEIEQEIMDYGEKLLEIEREISQKKTVKNNYIVQKDDYFQKKVVFIEK